MPAFPKPRPAQLERDEKRAAREAFDRAESEKARKRALGRCEVYVGLERCRRRDSETHHLKGGSGIRARGDSALAQLKIRVCLQCHHDITRKVLVPINPQADARSMRYRRRR